MSYSNIELQRFLEAQNKLYTTALSELKRGKKETHWMWFVFPQYRGLGKSNVSDYYGIKDLDEANRYMQHPVLSRNLIEATGLLLEYKKKSAEGILGDLGAMKLLSSMTLFSQTENANPIFQEVIDTFFFGCIDAKTASFIHAEPSSILAVAV